MKRRALTLLALLSLISLVFSAPVTRAQSPQPPTPPAPPSGRDPSPYPQPPEGNPAWDESDPYSFPSRTGPGGGVNPLSPAVDLGQPGLSFRYVETFGVTAEPYLADGEHLFIPDGLFIDASDKLYVVERLGFRMLKYNQAGENKLIIGHAGQPWHHDDYLASPKDVVVGANGQIWILISSALKEFDASGAPVQIFPETGPWASGTENDRFDNPQGLAFDAVGKLYVSDTNNHRIQVFDVSGGTPVYESTIGETGVPHADNTGFNQPWKIAFDASNRLYVYDHGNFRVQRCEFAGAWNCSTYFGETGVPGDDLAHLGDYPAGLWVQGGDIYIADAGNQRVLKCNPAGTCGLFAGVTDETGSDNAHFNFPVDVAVDSLGTVYVSDQDNQRVQKFSSAGAYQGTIGVTRVPYVPDEERLNTPMGIALGKDGSIYTTENRGFRLVKLDAEGVQQWVVVSRTCTTTITTTSAGRRETWP
ncbi:MAG TPA: NHL repeat-containing protein [Anaerolineales bacterium]|nr:NHL repeat-containing protein [Anaerolineales bacterium]